MLKWILIVFALTGCQTAQQRAETLVQDRIEKLKPLSTWRSSWCEVQVELTEPTKARYSEMFPTEREKILGEPLAYTWKSRESTCEITPLDTSAVSKAQAGFLETGICLLLQTHYVNSPFDELVMQPGDIQTVGKGTAQEMSHIRAGKSPELGIFMPFDAFRVETRTRSRGILNVTYGPFGENFLPTALSQTRDGTTIALDEFTYNEGERRPMIESFWLSLGTGEAIHRQSQVKIRGCRPL